MPTTIVVQSSTDVSRLVPPAPETTTPDKQASDPETVIVVNTPSPAGITAPVNEKPNTVLPPKLTVKPLSAAAPPDAPVTPSTSNWNPAISTSLSYKTSTDVS